MTPTDRIIVQLLAIRNAAFAPVRKFVVNNQNANAFIMRRRHGETGSPWASGAAGPMARKRAQRALEDAVAAALVSPVLSGNKTVAVRLTDAGERQAAALCGQFLPGDIESRDVLAAIILRKTKAVGAGTVPEDDLRALPFVKLWKLNRNGELLLIQDTLLPYIVRGFVDARSTVHGNVRYWLSGDRPDAFTFGKPADADLYSVEADRFYTAAFDNERERLAAADAFDASEIGPCPLPVSAANMSEVDDWKMSGELAARGL
jgi:hypothetical protein